MNEDVTLHFACQFDMNALQYHLEITAYDSEGNFVDQEEIITDAFVTEYGGLDAYIEVDGEQRLLSEFAQTIQLENCGWLTALIKVVVVIVVVYVVVAETAEQIRSKNNLKENQKLEADGKGLSLNNYITNQKTSSRIGYNSANYKFGFTTFEETGCEVASVYNLLIKLGKAEMLSTVINNFEKWAIEFSIGWGKLGSNPNDIYRYFKKVGIKYTKYTSYSSFTSALSTKKNCKVVMSTWNDGGMLNSIFTGVGLHTYFFTKESDTSFLTYNVECKYNNPKTYTSIEDIYAQGGNFICAYIIE